ncbi:nucleoside diphosphate kinase, putative [Eimeria brunetti]|uniref:Nucleoside diphosphate kinase, putative n=1 Tax=Eimeria brunetti TaxID=51314 RepID=U6LL05_9EIME|nr:nucleoside diphosphate kinase, putative [Eimeria brunetti]
MAARPGDGAVLLLFPEILRQKKGPDVEELLLDTCYDIIKTKTFAFTEDEANEAFPEVPEGWTRDEFIEELTRGLSTVILLQHPLGKTRKRLAESLAAAAAAPSATAPASAAEAIVEAPAEVEAEAGDESAPETSEEATNETTDSGEGDASAEAPEEEDETGLAEAFRKAFCIATSNRQQYYLSDSAWTFERDILFFYPSVKSSEVERSVLLLKPDVTAAAAAAEARGESCPERGVEILLLEEGLTILASVEFQLHKQDVEKLFPSRVGKPDYPEMEAFLCEASGCKAIAVEGYDALRRLRQLCGPPDPARAAVLRPYSLRALCGTSLLRNGFHAPKTRGEATRFLELLFGSPPHPQPLIRVQRTFGIFLMKDLVMLQLQQHQRRQRLQQRPPQLQQRRLHQQPEQKQDEIRKLLKQKGFYILWEKEVHLDKETVGLVCQEWQDRPDYQSITTSLEGQEAWALLLARAGAPRAFADLLGPHCPVPFGAAAAATAATAAASAAAAAAAAKTLSCRRNGNVNSEDIVAARLRAEKAAATAAVAAAVVGMPRPGSLCGMAGRCVGFAAAGEQEAAALATACSARQLPLLLPPAAADAAASYLLEAGDTAQGPLALEGWRDCRKGPQTLESLLLKCLKALCKENPRPEGLEAVAWIGRWLAAEVERDKQSKQAVAASAQLASRVRPGEEGKAAAALEQQQQQQKKTQEQQQTHPRRRKLRLESSSKRARAVLFVGDQQQLEQQQQEQLQQQPETAAIPILSAAEVLREAASSPEPAKALRSRMSKVPQSEGRSNGCSNSSSAILVSIEQELGSSDWQTLAAALPEVQPLTVIPQGVSVNGSAAAAALASAKATGRLINPSSSSAAYSAITAALRPSVVFVFADPGLPLEPLLQRLCRCFGLAHIDMDKLSAAAAAAAPTMGGNAAAAKKKKNSHAPIPASGLCSSGYLGFMVSNFPRSTLQIEFVEEMSRGILHTADLSALKCEGLAAPPKLMQQLLQQAAAKKLQARVLLLHGPPQATATAAAAAKDVLPATVVADAEALLSLEQQQCRLEEQQEGGTCRYCGDADASCECLSDAGLLLSRALNKLAWLRGAPLLALQLPPSLLGAAAAQRLGENCNVCSLLHLLPVTAADHVPEEEDGLAVVDAEPPSAALLHFAAEGKAKRVVLVGDDDLVRLREVLSSILRCEVTALVAPKGLASVALGKAVARSLGLRLIPDFEQYVKELRQRQREQGSAATEAGAKAGAAGKLAKVIHQAKGKLRAPAVVAEALRALRTPQGDSVGNGVLLLDMLDSVELAEELESRQLNLTRVIILEAPEETLAISEGESGEIDTEEANEEEGESRLVREKKMRDQIANIYKDRCVRIHLSAAAAAAARAPTPTPTIDTEDEGPSPAEIAAAEAKAAAAAAKEIASALMKPAAFVVVDGFLQPEAAAALRQGLALGLTNKLFVVERKYLGAFAAASSLRCFVPRSPHGARWFPCSGMLIVRQSTGHTCPAAITATEVSAAARIWKIKTAEIQIEEGCTATELSPKIELLLQELQQPRELSPLEELQLNPPAPEPPEKEGSESEEEEEEA